MCLVSITYIQCVATLYIVVYIQYDDSGMSQSHWLCVAVKTVVDEAFDAAAAAASYCKTPDEDDDGVSINIEFVWQLSVCLSVCLVYVVWNTAMHTHTHVHTYIVYIHVNSEYNSLIFGQLLYKQINNVNLNLNTYILHALYCVVYVLPKSIMFYVHT